MPETSPQSSRSSRALRTTLVASALGYAAQGLSLLAIPLFLKTVGAEGYGLMVTVMAFMGYLSFADAGLSWGAMILIAQAEGRRDRTGIAHIVRHGAALAVGSGAVVLLGVTAILAAAAAGWRLPMFAHHPEADRLVLIAGLQLALNLQFGIVYNLFQGLQEGYWTSLYAGAARLLGLAGAMVAAYATSRVDMMLLAQLGCTVVGGLAATLHAWWRHPWAFAVGDWRDRGQYAAQLRIGGKNFLLQMGRTLGGTAPTLAISSLLGPAAVPLYTVPTTLLTMFLAPISAWNASMQSAYGEAWASGATEWVRAAFRLTIERALVAGGLGIGLFLVLADPLVRTWTHGRLHVEWSTAVAVAVIVLLGTLVTASQFLLSGLNHHRRAALAELANGLVALMLVPAGVYFLGLGGAGVGVAVSACATSVWVLRREISLLLGPRWLPSAGFVAKVGVASAAGTLAAWLVFHRVRFSDDLPVLLPLLIAGACGALLYGLLAYGLKLMSPEMFTAAWRALRRRAPVSA